MLIIFASISGLIAGMGIGGGTLFIIFSTVFLEFEQKYAQTLNLIMFLSVGLTATIFNIKDKNIDFKLAKKILPFLITGCLVGTSIVKKINNENLKKYFSCFMVLIGIYEIITSLIKLKKAKNNTNK